MTATRPNASQIIDLPICGYYDKQRVIQFNPTDAANWVLIDNPLAKKQVAMYPAMGRRRVVYLNQTRLNFPAEPRDCFRSINYAYYIVENQIYRVDKYFNQIEIANGSLLTNSGDVYCDYLIVGSTTYVGFTDGQKLYIYEEASGSFAPCNDPGAPKNPTFIAAFGNRFVVVGANTAVFNLTEVNLSQGAFNINNIFNIGTLSLPMYVFASEVSIIRQLGVFQNTLYIFTDYSTGLWSNRPTSLQSVGGTIVSFPFQKNTSIEFDCGIADPKTLDTNFNRMTWVSKTIKGLLQTTCLTSSQPTPINSKAIDVLFQDEQNEIEVASPFLTERLSGFTYEYENTIFYRLNAGNWSARFKSGVDTPTASSIEFNFEQGQWSRCIEKDGQRNRAQRMIHFSNRNLVTVQGDDTVYQFTGQVFTNESRNLLQSDITAKDAFIVEPFRYERITPIITIKNLNQIGYAEFETEYVEIDFAYGLQSYRKRNAPFENAVFLTAENSTPTNPIYIASEDSDEELFITENSNFPTLQDVTYFNWWKPHIELLYSDDGGISFTSADVQDFSDLGVYEWRMRWYNLSSSRNRCYRLYIVSPAPMYVLGGCQKVRRISGGAD